MSKIERMKQLPEIMERVRKHVNRMHFAKVVPCDVCIENFIEDPAKAQQIARRILAESLYYSPEDMTPELLSTLYPGWDKPSADGRLRVHGITKDGKYQTYCHFCDADMCLSQVVEGPNWDERYESQYGDSLLHHLRKIFPEPKSQWEALIGGPIPYFFHGSTAWLVSLELLVPSPPPESLIVTIHDGRKWMVSITGDDSLTPLIRLVAQSKKFPPPATQ